MLDKIHGKYFSLIDLEGFNTVVYLIERTEEKDKPKYIVKRLEYTKEYYDKRIKKTFFVDDPAPDGNHLVLLTFGNNKVMINSGFLDFDHVKVEKRTTKINFNLWHNTEGESYKEFDYNPDQNREFCILDTDNGDEMVPIVYIDSQTGKLKGKFKLKQNHRYFVFEVKKKLR